MIPIVFLSCLFTVYNNDKEMKLDIKFSDEFFITIGDSIRRLALLVV